MANRSLKSLLLGMAGALTAGVLAIVASLAYAALRLRLTTPTESGGISAVSVGFPGVVSAIAVPVGFAIGFYWRFRRDLS
jgi:ABC-type spermidine/putrescine transport system permease subunit II